MKQNSKQIIINYLDNRKKNVAQKGKEEIASLIEQAKTDTRIQVENDVIIL